MCAALRGQVSCKQTRTGVSQNCCSAAQMEDNQKQEVSCVFLSHPQQHFHTKSLGFTDYTFPQRELSAVESLTEKNKLEDGRGCSLLLCHFQPFPLISCLRWLSLPFFQFLLSDYEVDLPSSFHSVCMRGSEVDLAQIFTVFTLPYVCVQTQSEHHPFFSFLYLVSFSGRNKLNLSFCFSSLVIHCLALGPADRVEPQQGNVGLSGGGSVISMRKRPWAALSSSSCCLLWRHETSHSF